MKSHKKPRNLKNIYLVEFLDNKKTGNTYKYYVCPNIQREFVWEKKQAIDLFTSINDGLFVGSLLFWNPPTKDSLDQFGGFFHLPISIDDERQPILPSNLKKNNLIAIIDGQQRISSLVIGIYGTWQGKTLCFDGKQFKFIDYDRENPKKGFPFVSLDKIIYERKEKLEKEGIFLSEGHRHFKKQFHSFCIPAYFLPQKSKIRDIIETFKRINQKGTDLTRGQLLLSEISPKWGNARKELKRLVVYIKRECSITLSYEFIVNSYLFCKDLLENEKLKLESKNVKDEKDIMTQSVSDMPDQWSQLESAIKKMAKTVKGLGFSDSTISSYNALVPLVYIYCAPQKAPKDDNIIRKYLYISFLKKVFASSSDTVLNDIHKTLKDNNLAQLLKQNPKFEVDEGDLSDILELEKGRLTKIALHLLYAKGQESFDDDHMHPKATIKNYDSYVEAIEEELEDKNNIEFFKNKDVKRLLAKKTWKEIRKKCNKLPNLQPLWPRDNRKKLTTPLAKCGWKPFRRAQNFLNKNTSLLLSNFEDFFKERSKKMTEELKRLINP